MFHCYTFPCWIYLHFLLLLICFYLILFVFLLGSVFKITNPLIYDEKNFTPLVGEMLSSTIKMFETAGGISVKVFAKSASFGQKGECLKHIKYLQVKFFTSSELNFIELLILFSIMFRSQPVPPPCILSLMVNMG